MTGVSAPRHGGRYQQMQAFEDAICWRTGRLAAPCSGCAAAQGAWCDDHGRDVDLIAEYEQAAHRLAQAAP